MTLTTGASSVETTNTTTSYWGPDPMYTETELIGTQTELIGTHFKLDGTCWTVYGVKWGFFRLLVAAVSIEGKFRIFGRPALHRAEFYRGGDA